MGSAAPNMCAAIGSEVAAKLMGIAGGPPAVSCAMMPMNRAAVLDLTPGCLGRGPDQPVQDAGMQRPGSGGQAKDVRRLLNLHGAASPGNFPCLGLLTRSPSTWDEDVPDGPAHLLHPLQGAIYNCEIIQMTPPALRSRAIRLVAGKVSLLARMDAYGQDPSVRPPPPTTCDKPSVVDAAHCQPGDCRRRALAVKRCGRKWLRRSRSGRSRLLQRLQSPCRSLTWRARKSAAAGGSAR